MNRPSYARSSLVVHTRCYSLALAMAALAAACSGGGLGGTMSTTGGAAATVGGSGDDSGGSSAQGGQVGAGGTITCEQGNETCPCYPNQTCNSGLECRSNLCVSPGGSSGGAPSVGGNAGVTGGTPSAGGTAQVTGGTPGSGGTAQVTGGTPGSGGTAQLTGGTASGGYPTGGTPSGTGGAADNRHISGPWAGYLWTSASGTGSTISPSTYDSHTPGTPYCATGNVGAMSDYSGVAIIGYNLNQAMGSDVLGTWTPSSLTGGITVSYTNSQGSELRLQIQTPNGATVDTERWCYKLTGSSGTVTIPWTSFSTTCWNTKGVSYAGQALQALMLLVPGQNLAIVPFNICLNSVAPA